MEWAIICVIMSIMTPGPGGEGEVSGGRGAGSGDVD